MYKLSRELPSYLDIPKYITKISDGSLIPFDPANTDYQAYLAWVAEGGVPEPADEVSGE